MKDIDVKNTIKPRIYRAKKTIMCSTLNSSKVVQKLVEQNKIDYKTFCSWECLKIWNATYCPLQKKYANNILIDVAAGYNVQI
jgi:hypothetical protein